MSLPIIDSFNKMIKQKNKTKKLYNHFLFKMLFFIVLATLFSNSIYLNAESKVTHLIPIIFDFFVIGLTVTLCFNQGKSPFFYCILSYIMWGIISIKAVILTLAISSIGLLPFFEKYSLLNESFIYWVGLINFILLPILVISIFNLSRDNIRNINSASEAEKKRETKEYINLKNILDNQIKIVLGDKDLLHEYNNLLKKDNLTQEESDGTSEIFRQAREYRQRKISGKNRVILNQSTIRDIT